MFNFGDVQANSLILKSRPIFEILEAAGSLTKVLSSKVQKSGFGSKHSPKITWNLNNITINPNSDHCSFEIEFLPNFEAPQCE